MNDPPVIDSRQKIFIDKMSVSITTERENVNIHYTLDGTNPSSKSPSTSGGISITETSLVTAQNFRDGNPVSGIVQTLFTKVTPNKGVEIDEVGKGLRNKYF